MPDTKSAVDALNLEADEFDYISYDEGELAMFNFNGGKRKRAYSMLLPKDLEELYKAI
jgi:hypothetical protein